MAPGRPRPQHRPQQHQHTSGAMAAMPMLVRPAAAVLLVLASTPAVQAGRRVNSFAGPFIVYFDKSYQCEPAGDKSDGSMKIYVRPSHFRNPRQVQTDLQTMTGNITFRLPGNDSFWILLKVDLRSQNQWKENAFIFNIPGGGCTAMRSYAPKAYHTVFKRDPKSRETCIFPQGVHFMSNMPLNFSHPKLAIMQYGHWRVKFTGGIVQRQTLCMMVEARTLPRIY